MIFPESYIVEMKIIESLFISNTDVYIDDIHSDDNTFIPIANQAMTLLSEEIDTSSSISTEIVSNA